MVLKIVRPPSKGRSESATEIETTSPSSSSPRSCSSEEYHSSSSQADVLPFDKCVHGDAAAWLSAPPSDAKVHGDAAAWLSAPPSDAKVQYDPAAWHSAPPADAIPLPLFGQQPPQFVQKLGEQVPLSIEPSGQVQEAGATPRTLARRSSKKQLKKQVQPKEADDEEITTLMILDIPCRITPTQMADTINNLGFKGTYDFLHIPACGGASTTKSNLGYGFINFVAPSMCGNFAIAFEGFRFSRTASLKVCRVRIAHVQGLAANLLQFTDAAKRNSVLYPVTI